MVISDNKVKHLTALLLPMASFFSVSCAVAEHGSTVLKESDFRVEINQHVFALGDRWNSVIQKQAGAPISENFVGDVPAGEVSYKYYQHKYDGFDIYTANLFWQKEQRDINSYLIAQITIYTPEIKTARGIGPGDSQDALFSKYGQGTLDDSDNQHWVYYDAGYRRLSFQLEHKKISHIMMSLNPDD